LLQKSPWGVLSAWKRGVVSTKLCAKLLSPRTRPRNTNRLLCYVVREIFGICGENSMEIVNTVFVTQCTGTHVTTGGTYSELQDD